MLILTIRTNKPLAEIGLYKDRKRVAYEEWNADRQLAETIHLKIKELLDQQKLELQSLQGIVVYKGPGSFTGLRISLSVANALADSLNIPIIGSSGEDWLEKGCKSILKGCRDSLVLPKYGSPPHITVQKK